jgi:regulator of protease activity HflC (stomatin/prohibitin superfamily)
MLGVFVFTAVALFAGLIGGAAMGFPPLVVLVIFLSVFWFIGLRGFFSVQPNNSAVITLFGNYVGTAQSPGLWWINPFTTRRAVSLRVRNLETQRLKVNDSNSNPIEIAAIVVWKVVDSSEACFEVDDYERYVNIQSEAAVRTLAQRYPYDAHTAGEVALSTHTNEISTDLQAAVEERLAKAGVAVIEARISHLAYAPEIAAAMLQRQQASAVVAARSKIVEGAVGMVEHALELLAHKKVVELDEERKAAMVSNLLVVLCSDRAASPVVNAGSLY